MGAISSVLLLCAIELSGVVGGSLRARAFFDANNVKVGDPLVLTVDFLGNADFKSLHPPALSRAVSRKDWKVDDASAKTDTFRDARRLTYRVRPMREGVVWFPAMEFSYLGRDGGQRTVRSNEIPVHAKAGAQVVVEEMLEYDEGGSASQPQLTDDPYAFSDDPEGLRAGMNDDMLFAWRKACAKPSADAFAQFDFPAAKLNEAACSLKDGNWARAMGIYRRLEWRIGQTPEIERGIVAALSLKSGAPAELPVWRQVLRPLLALAWKLRVATVVGTFAAVALLLWLLGRGIRAVACAAFALLVSATALAETVETVTTNADGSVTHRKVVTGSNGSYSFSFSSSSSSGGSPARGKGVGFGIEPSNFFDDFDPFGMSRRRQKRPTPKISVRLSADKQSVSVGEDFNLLLEMDMPQYISFADGVSLALAEQNRLQQLGGGQVLRAVQSDNPTNVVQRLLFPMRAVAPFEGLHFSVSGEYVFAGDHPFFRTAYPYSSGQRSAAFTAKPPPEAGRPRDFGGVVAESANLFEYCDALAVETNDVVTITYRLSVKGFVPDEFQPKDVAFEWRRQEDASGRPSEIEYKRYFVADGTAETPRLSVPYYDPRRKAYRTASAGGTRLVYRSAESSGAANTTQKQGEKRK